jgi:hypothetical protein
MRRKELIEIFSVEDGGLMDVLLVRRMLEGRKEEGNIVCK